MGGPYCHFGNRLKSASRWAALDDIAGWQDDGHDDNLAARDAMLETCEAAIMGGFILTFC